MVFLTSTFTPLLSERYGGSALLFIPASAVTGVVLGWCATLLLFSLLDV